MGRTCARISLTVAATHWPRSAVSIVTPSADPDVDYHTHDALGATNEEATP